MGRIIILIVLGFCLAAFWVTAAAATPRHGPWPQPNYLLVQSEQDRAKAAVRSGQVQPLPRILSSIQREFRGRLSDARLQRRGSSWIYKVKWLTPQSNMLAITVDARSGRILGVSGRGANAARKR